MKISKKQGNVVVLDIGKTHVKVILFDDFKELNPTAENISKIIYNRLRNKLDSKFELKIKLYETERNIVVYPA